MTQNNPFGSRAKLKSKAGDFDYFRLASLQSIANIENLPYSIRVLLESCLRNVDQFVVHEDDVTQLAKWNAKSVAQNEIPFKPGRVILQDFTGVPAVVDLAALRSALARLGGDPKKINPLVPVDLVIDHSVQVDFFGNAQALLDNEKLEFHRNKERYEFLHWGQKAFKNFKAVPPSTGIVHQVNLEYLARGVMTQDGVAFPDSLVGTDSHTTMINGLGVVGWGVGGIEAEAVMLGQPIFMVTPEVVGFRLTGKLPEGTTATDLVLTVTQMLRKLGVVEKFVEFYGPGARHLSLADRATIANMAPEYGATMGYFPVDEKTLEYMRLTGRSEDQIDLVDRYCKENLLFHHESAPEPTYSDTMELDLSAVQPCLAGPKRPQDRIGLFDMQAAFQKALSAPVKERGFGLPETKRNADSAIEGSSNTLTHGSVVIAAITSCTNTSNPSVLIAAGLLARNAVAKGLKVPDYVKTSLAPGSRVVTSYLEALGLDKDLEKCNFFTVGYGCTTCIGNSGPLPEPVRAAVQKEDLVVASVLSGNRNFEGRINPDVKANYLASPPLVVAYALAGTIDINFEKDPIGQDANGKPVMLKDIWPSQDDVQAAILKAVTPERFIEQYQNAYSANNLWNAIKSEASDLYGWDEKSTYIQEPPFFEGISLQVNPIQPKSGLRVLAKLGDSVTTDHISPAGSISKNSPAARYLLENGVEPAEFNSYGSRRGNDRVMTRGTFANIRLRNQMAPGTEGGYTKNLLSGEVTDIFTAAAAYKKAGIPLLILAGKEYGTGSSRDWAAKGTMLLGVTVVLAESFERIHRSNLVGMGILPLVYEAGQTAETLGLTGEETFAFPDLNDQIKTKQKLTVAVTRPDGSTFSFSAIARLDTPVEIKYYRNGGILNTVLRELAQG
ncbi:MAG: aconitate hydratase AcnA [Acidobacteria bacterium]|nr:aconitate hydratase AcnA [Acidobacteriota bacterium]